MSHHETLPPPEDLDDRPSGWGRYRRDVLYALMILAGLGGGWKMIDSRVDNHDITDEREHGEVAATLKNHKDLFDAVGRRLDALEKDDREGSPLLGQLRRDVESNTRAITILQDSRLVDLRGGITKSDIDNINRRLDEGRDRDAELGRSIDTLRSTILGEATRPLVGPRR
jgi:hypothetical protein